MLHNDVLRSVRYLLNVDDAALSAIARLGGASVSAGEMSAMLKREDEAGYRACSDETMSAFLDGLIVHLRGPKPDAQRPREPERVSNNLVLKKLRVAFKLEEQDLVEMMAAAGFAVSRPELSALFRNPAHRNYRPCGDQFLRNFLKSLTARIRRS